jgi:hypothetical protein
MVSNYNHICSSWVVECFPVDRSEAGDPATVPVPAAFQRWLDNRLGTDREDREKQGRVVVKEI